MISDEFLMIQRSDVQFGDEDDDEDDDDNEKDEDKMADFLIVDEPRSKRAEQHPQKPFRDGALLTQQMEICPA